MNEILMILYAYSVNYPILKSWGCCFARPIALVFNGLEGCMQFCEKLSPKPVILNVSDKHQYVEKVLKESNSEAVVLFYRNYRGYAGKDVRTNLDAIFSAAQTGKIGGTDVTCAPYLILDKIIPDDLRNLVVEIHIDDISMPEIQDFLEMIPSTESLGIVKDEIKGLKRDYSYPIQAATAFLKPWFNEQGQNEKYAKLLDMCKNFVCDYNFFENINQISNLVISEITEYYKNKKPKAIPIEELPEAELSELDHAFIFDKKSLYLKETLFKKICADLLGEFISVNNLKFGLVKEGLLHGKEGTYTLLIRVKTVENNHYMRVMAFDIDKMPELRSFLLLIRR